MESMKEIYYWDSNPNDEQSIIVTNEFKIDPKQEGRFYVIDNFFEDPYAVRNFALQQKFFDGEGAVGARTRKQFLWEGLRERFEEIIGHKIQDHTENGYGWNDIGINGRFQYCKAGTPMVYHCDVQRWAGLIFLTPDAPPQSGTSFYRHKETKRAHRDIIQTEGDVLEVFNNKTFLDPTPFEKTDTVANVFNRLVIFDGGLIHSGNDYFGWDLESSLLFKIFFFE